MVANDFVLGNMIGFKRAWDGPRWARSDVTKMKEEPRLNGRGRDIVGLGGASTLVVLTTGAD